MSKQNYFVDGTFIDRLGTLIERTLVQADCVVAPTSTPDTSISTRDAVLNITIPKIGGGTEVKEVRYFKLDLATLASFNLVKGKCNENSTVHALLPTIQRLTGIPFTTNDLEDAPVVVTGSVTEFTLPLVAKVGSKWFKGRYDLPVSRKVQLSALATLGTYMGAI
ncbi:hypothetical protein D3C85_341630 [compost metagenome]